jgi:hypothetical protein
MSEMDDLVIELLADAEAGLRERIEALEDETTALRTLAQSRGDDAATLRIMLLQAWDCIYREVGYWKHLPEPDDDRRQFIISCQKERPRHHDDERQSLADAVEASRVSRRPRRDCSGDRTADRGRPGRDPVPVAHHVRQRDWPDPTLPRQR